MSIQDEIVAFGGGNVVVSASAGCGKTTTMIRRISRLILDRACGTDELLVVTFTNAAAAEMREKLANALRAEAGDPYVTEQLYKLETADICTIDSFCNRVLKKYFYEADVDPNFEIAESGEAAMLKLRAAETAVAAEYAAGREDFLRLADALGGDRTDRELARLVMRLMDLSANFSDRESYLREILPDNCRADGAAAKFMLEDISGTLAEYARRFEALTDDPFLTESDSASCAEYARLAASGGSRTLDGWREFFEFFALPPVRRLRKAESEDPAIAGAHERVKAAKSAFGEEIKRFRAKYLFLSEAELAEKCDAARPLLVALARLTLSASETFGALKERSAMLDFNDVERLAFRILQKESVRKELLSRYKYVFLDEAQDINRFQEELLGLLCRGDNAFFVGDLKQCIYRFRGARPEIFADRCRASEGTRGFFRLSENFRTNAEILNFVNRVFDRCMRRDFSPVDYAKSERLAGRKTGRIEDGRPAVVCTLIREQPREKRQAPPLYRIEREEEGAGLAEGLFVAKEITSLVHGGRISEEGETRPVRYADIAVLVRGKKAFSDGVRRALAAAGIPVACDFEYPLLHYPEITVLVDYLKLVDNFRQDIPLVSALGSSFGNFSAEELAEIRLAAPGEKFFADAFLRCAGREQPETAAEAAAAVAPAGGRSLSPFSGHSSRKNSSRAAQTSLQAKCAAFLARLEGFRERSRVLSCPDLIAEIVRETRYDVCLEREGEGKAARLRSFLSKVSDKTYAESLSRLLRFLEEFSDSFLIAERAGGADAVLVTTIHKSKGLEYPVVFLAGLDGGFNFGDARSAVCVDLTLGGGMELYDPVSRTREELPVANAVRRSIRYNAVRDEMNLLYVAMTRAKYRLYLSGACAPGAEEKEESVRAASRFLDFILPVLAGSGAELNVAEESEVPEPRPAVPLFRAEPGEWNGYFGFTYKVGSDLPVKATVTELNDAFGDPLPPSERNIFPEESPFFGAGNPRLEGTAYHKYLELASPAVRTEADFGRDLARLGALLSPEERALLDPAVLLPFFAEVYAPRRPKKILREQPFMLYAPASELFPEGGAEKILVQGKIDLVFVYDDFAEVVDYKLSRLSEGELAAKYRRQVEIYCRAAEQCLGIPVKAGYLYHFGLNRLICVKN